MKTKKTKTVFPHVVIVESVNGNWFYHLAVTGQTSKALCGAWTMHSGAKVDSWGFVRHNKERYCAKCATQLSPPHRGMKHRHDQNETAIPNPGSDDAMDAGCQCARIDNGRGTGAWTRDKDWDKGGEFWITEGCPLHAPTAPQQ